MTEHLDPLRVQYGDAALRRRQADREGASQQMRELGVRWGKVREWALATGRWMPADVPMSGINARVVQEYYDTHQEGTADGALP